MPELAVVIVSYNTEAILRECLAAVIAVCDMARTEIVVVDNASTDGSIEMVAANFPGVRLLAQPRNLGFGGGNNIGVLAATAPYVMLLNSDAILLEDTGFGLMRYLRDHPDVVCVAPRIVLPDGTPQPRVFGHLPSLWRVATQSLQLGALFPRARVFDGTDGHARAEAETDVGWVSGVCMVMRRADFLAVDGFDPAFFMYCEDVDLCARLARRGGRIVRLDRLAVRHYGGASSASLPAQLRNAVWQQRNFLEVVRRQSGQGGVLAARALLSLGLLLRIAAGLALAPKRGVGGNLLLRASWLRMRDLVGARSVIAG